MSLSHGTTIVFHPPSAQQGLAPTAEQSCAVFSKNFYDIISTALTDDVGTHILARRQSFGLARVTKRRLR